MKAIDSLQPLKWYAHCLSLEKNAGYVRCREQRRMNVSLHDTSFRVWCFEVSYFMSIVINSFGIFLSRFTSFLKILKRSSLPEANKISLSTTREFFKRWWNILSLITIEKKKLFRLWKKSWDSFENTTFNQFVESYIRPSDTNATFTDTHFMCWCSMNDYFCLYSTTCPVILNGLRGSEDHKVQSPPRH